MRKTMRITGGYNRTGTTYVGHCTFLLERFDDEVSVRLLTYPESTLVSYPNVSSDGMRRTIHFAIPVGHHLHIGIKHAGAKYNYAYGSLLNDQEEQPGLFIEYAHNIAFALGNDDVY